MPARRRGSAFRTPTQRAQLWEKKMDGETYSRILSRTKHLALPRITEYQTAHENLISTVKSVLERSGRTHQTHEYMWYAQKLYKQINKYAGQALLKEAAATFVEYFAKGLDYNTMLEIASSLGINITELEDKITKIMSSIGIGGGAAAAAAALVVAAENTPKALKTRADFTCDGISDQEEINQALSQGGIVVLCPGTYVIDGPIIMPSYSRLMGSGISTIIRLRDRYNADINLIRNSDLENGNTGIIIENLMIDGNKANQEGVPTQNGIYFYKVDSSTISSCYIKNFINYGILLEESNKCEILGNICESCNGDAISLYMSPECIISKNTLIENLYGIRADESSNRCEISCNTLSNNNHGITIVVSNACSIIGNICKNTFWEGIYLFSANYCTVSGNILIENYDGVLLGASSHNVISGNLFHKNYSHGIYMFYSSHNLISGNIVRGEESTSYAIYIGDVCCELNVIEGNDLYQSGTMGDIYDAGTNTRRRDNIGNDGSWLADA